ncbi:MAG: hypothetical protein JKY70_18440 [Mucilaginibacter sp.]|nr:hypothetical protein [Mucilaginibacter sp.]
MIKNLQNRSIAIISFFAVAIIALSGCKKDNTGESLTVSISADIDGTNKVFDKNVAGGTITSEGQQITIIQGSATDGSQIAITLAGKLTSGKTFSNNAANDDDKPVILYNEADASYANDDSAVSNIAGVTLTSASSTSAKGTFTGDLIEVSFGNDVKRKVITNGKFSVKLTTQNVQ